MLISALVCLAAVSASVDAKTDYASQANAFAFTLANKLGFSDSKKNELVSPISVGMDFTMLLNGTTGKTRKELAKVLGWPEGSLAGVNAWASSLIKNQDTQDSAQMVYANAIFSRDVELKPSYVQEMKRWYSAELGKLPAREAEALATVNGWVNGHTKHRIPKILDQLRPLDCIVLLNATTFDGKWFTYFSPNRTKPGIFHSPSGRTDCQFMENPSLFSQFHEDSKAQYLKLGYRGGRYAMMFMLPAQGQSLGSVLSVDTFEKAQKDLKPKDGYVSLPKFRFESGYDLIPTFKKLGAKRLFNFTTDYGNMVPKEELMVSQAVHKGFIEVNEQGTKAGAATAIVMTRKGLSPKPDFQFVADHPFAFALLDSKSGAILFLGVVNKP